MKHIIMLAGVAALGFAGPAFAKPGHGQGHGNSYGYGRGSDDEGGDRFVPGRGYDDDGDEGEGLRGQALGYGAGGCPPGLAKKTPACIPPGLARHQGVTGHGMPYGYAAPYGAVRVPYGYATPYSYANPYGYANPYAATPYAPYGSYGAPYYGNSYNPQAQILQQIIGSLVR